mmetsp:Transcript_16740/g.33480  ORF Transcript_16740/g.33480 Transcript_16740/m.33480 type:complete len:87 (-) Transcript_16740:187-447(-)|eukprot:CAMPEP_0181326812 /NCGR_PEP_ID=MMETSP1101-20121128/21724_1 /TAXON_ID=46948 /ORGANISM="Rhodomonas abbreviata, Strain Caron Lab Isolate" /LENGTH=86 /DNA_ID=CAMNT_0023435343 /DNA_START=253 /DNA_END=513 /DNA_ORIENTATION=+
MGSCLGKCLGKGGPGSSGNTLGGGDSLGGGYENPDRERLREAAERRAEEQAKRGVQGNKPTLVSPTKDTPAGGRNEVNYADAKTWN